MRVCILSGLPRPLRGLCAAAFNCRLPPSTLVACHAEQRRLEMRWEALQSSHPIERRKENQVRSIRYLFSQKRPLDLHSMGLTPARLTACIFDMASSPIGSHAAELAAWSFPTALL